MEKRKDASFRKTLPKAQMWLWALDDNFEFCTAQCRTSSRTVIHQNAFKSPLKHCYGPTGPSLTNTGADRHERGTDNEDSATNTKAARDVVHHDDIDQKDSEAGLEDVTEEKRSNEDAEPTVTVDAADTSSEGQTANDDTDSAESDSASDEALDQIDAAVQTGEKLDASVAKSTEMELILERLKRVEEEKKALEEENKRLKDRNFGEADTRASEESTTATLRNDEGVTAAVRSDEGVTLAALSHDMEHQHVYDQSVRAASAKLSPGVSSKFIRFSYYMMYIATAFSIWLSYYWDLA